MRIDTNIFELSKEGSSAFIRSIISDSDLSDQQILGLLQALSDMSAWERFKLLLPFADTPGISEEAAMAAFETVHISTVYVIADGTGRSKIGKADTPAKRKLALQTGASTPLTLHMEKVCGDGLVHRVEARAHALLAAKRGIGEWFQIDPAGAALVVEQAYDDVYGAVT